MPTLATANMESLYCMFKGEPGTRKSTQALSFPLPQYWFSFDQKMEGVLLPAKKWGVDLTKVEYDDYANWNKAEEKLKKLVTTCPFKTIVVDTVTTAGDVINIQTLALKSGTTSNAGEEKGKRIAGIPVNTMEDFNAETSALQHMSNKYLKDIQKYHKVNIILICHIIQVDQKTPGGATHISRSIVTGAKKLAAKLPGYCHEVYHFNMKGDFSDKRYSLLTSHSGDDFARTSLPLDKEIVFDDKPIYETYLIPAIERLKTMPVEQPKKF